MPFLDIILLVAGFLLLIKGADWLVAGSSDLARRFGIRDIVIGLTIVAFGTSAPELIVNLISAFRGSTDLALGNIVGSNISNLLFILGVAGLIYPLRVPKGTVWKEIPFSLLASFVLLFVVNDIFLDNTAASAVTRTDGLVMLLFLAIFLYYTYEISRSGSSSYPKTHAKRSWLVVTGLIASGIIGLALGGHLIVTGATAIASSLGISEALIGLTVVAIGTSLPELATSAVAAWRRQVNIAVGNIVGSNIFNVFFILATTSVIRPLPIPAALNFDILVLIVASLLLFFIMFIGKKHTVERWQAGLFFLSYLAYIVFITLRG